MFFFQPLLFNNYQLTLILILGHIDIPGNERVDSAARQATLLPQVNPLPPPASDFFTFIKSHILSHWNRTSLLQTSNKLHAVKRFRSTENLLTGHLAERKWYSLVLESAIHVHAYSLNISPLPP